MVVAKQGNESDGQRKRAWKSIEEGDQSEGEGGEDE